MKTPFQYSRFRLFSAFAIWWLFWGIVQFWLLYNLELPVQTAFIDATVSTLLLAMVSFSTVTIYRFYQPGQTNRLYRFVHWMVFTIIYCLVLRWILTAIFKNDGIYLQFLERSMHVRFVFTLLITSFLTILNWLMNYISEQQEKEKKQSEIENMMREAELVKLRQQLQPHFLFNSLNSINALVVTQPELARKMVQQLSDFLRGTLKKDDQKPVNLKDELAHLHLYLEIEKVRFGHRLNIEIISSAESLSTTLPPLILQPLVENAIKFGLYDTTGETLISVKTKKETDFLIIEIENPFDPETSSAVKGTGFGLSSVQRRLYLLYSRQDLLSTEKNKSTYKTILKIPQ